MLIGITEENIMKKTIKKSNIINVGFYIGLVIKAVYEMYSYMHSHSMLMLLIIMIDVAINVMIILEYKTLKLEK